jgi:hypothetical protein
MPRYIFTIIALVVFLFAYAYEEYRVFAQNVSPETSLAQYRDLHTVKEGVTPDGSIEISEVLDPPHVSHYIQYANHGRTLRAFLAPNRGGVGLIYIEQVRPHKFFAIIGAFSVVPETASILWTTPTTLVFYGTAPDATLMRYEIDLHTGIVRTIIVADFPTSELRPENILTAE